MHDPGVALVEVFAHLTEVMLYRLNRLPEKAYVEFLNLLGVTRHPPAAAWVDLTVTRAGTGRAADADRDPGRYPGGGRARRGPAAGGVRDHRVHRGPAGRAGRGDRAGAPLRGGRRGTARRRYRPARPGAAQREVADRQHHRGDRPAARRRGGPGRAAARRGRPRLRRPHVRDLAAGADVRRRSARPTRCTCWTARPARSPSRPPWTCGSDDATEPTPLAAVPAAGRQIRLWYRTGGGPAGNVAAGHADQPARPDPRGEGDQPRRRRAAGAAWSPIDSAMMRGPYEFFSLRRAITARDFELLATANSGAIARARAFTRSAMWSFARPGEVEVVLVPYVGQRAAAGLAADAPTCWSSTRSRRRRRRTEQDLDRRRALGTSVVASWATLKPVSVRGRVVVRPEEDVDAVTRRIHDRLYQTVSPLPTALNPTGWQFGEPLRASNVYRMLEQAEPGVRYVDEVRFVLQDAPDGRVRTVAADDFQAEDVVRRQRRDRCSGPPTTGSGWEPVGRFAGRGRSGRSARRRPRTGRASPPAPARSSRSPARTTAPAPACTCRPTSGRPGSASPSWSRSSPTWPGSTGTRRGGAAAGHRRRALRAGAAAARDAAADHRRAERPGPGLLRGAGVRLRARGTGGGPGGTGAVRRLPVDAPAARPGRSPTWDCPEWTPVPSRCSSTARPPCCGSGWARPTRTGPAGARCGRGCSRPTSSGRCCPRAGPAVPAGTCRSPAAWRSPRRRAAACCGWTPPRPPRSGSRPT